MEGSSRMAGLNEEGYKEVENSFAMDGRDQSVPGSENHENAEDQVADNDGDNRGKRRKHRRHTPYQIQELESFYEDCPNPNEKQRIELGNRIGLESKQVKCWFQNKRTQKKNQQEHQEHATKPLSKTCVGESSTAEHNLLIENARLREELTRVRGLAEKTLGKPTSKVVNALSRTVNAQGARNCEPTSLNFRASSGAGASSSSSAPRRNEYEGYLKVRGRSSYRMVAIASMEEVILLAQSNSPFWLRNWDAGREEFNHVEYRKRFNPGGLTPPGFAIEASRDNGPVAITSLDLVNVLMDPRRWVEMYPGFVVRASVVEVLCSGVAGTHDGELLLMAAELMLPSPFVPVRRGRFIRYCKRYPEGVWAVVDMSVHLLRDSFGDATKRCRRFPSGFIMQDIDTGCSVVTCVEHAEYDENSVHYFFRPLVRYGLCFGAHRWLAALQRQCESLAFLARSWNILPQVPSGITTEGKKSLMRLTRRVINGLCAGLCASPTLGWNRVNIGSMFPNLQIMTRVNIDMPGEVSGVLMGFSTSIWLPVSRQTMYDFLRDGQLRGHWDMLAINGPMQEVFRINKSIDRANTISILYPPVGSPEVTHMAVVQETWSDRTMSGVAYVPIDLSTASTIIGGGDSSFVKILPSGFVINDGYVNPVEHIPNGINGHRPASLLTLGFQVLTDNIPKEKLTVNSIQMVSVMMNQTIAKIKAAMQCS